MDTSAAQADAMNDAVAATLRAERGAAQITIARLAETSGVPERSLIRYLKGERDITVGDLMRISAALGLTAETVWARAAERMTR